ncbi:MAG: DNA polymerase III subunit beta [Candidatus Xenobium sp.]|jgi:DNA polymerase-3 subunit beta
MFLDCEKTVLENALNQVSRAISPRSPLPILGHILMEARGDELRLTATDLNIGVQTSIPVRIHEEGATTCSARLLAEIVGRLPAGPTTLQTVGEGMLKVTSGRTRFEVATLPAEEYPTLPVPENASSLHIPRKFLKAMVTRVGIAAAEVDESRPVMTGILTILDSSRITLVATDGRRLARMSCELEQDELEEAQVVIPARAMHEMIKVFGDGEGEVEIILADPQVFFRVPGVQFHCRILEGRFPDFNRVIPKSFQRTARFGCEVLANALRRMIIVAQEKDSPNMVRMEFEPDRLTLSANTPDLGSAREEIPALLEGEPLTIAFNGKFILDSLSVMDADEVQLDLQDESHSAVLRPLQDSSFDYVCMPVRLREFSTEPVGAV